ncbi:hypothetical protein GDO81_009841 [Engystomops pustulosus]|uniref:SH2 domain-containing protein n=1 Tax=Engystomops pustulosus TaxID=76066 RepID=A0AAV7BVE9_ENGPU|nr:hypothetical protein GDO81_009841 [Engystomops pustulosus]
MELPVMQGSDDGLPDWFHGIMSRRDCEELLKNKEIGHFIIRLSARTFGYILSYKGKDRCRHFVINQLSNGELVVSGDSYSHESLPALIFYYQNTPIEPFGEKLSQYYIKFTENNKYDNIQRPNSKTEKLVSHHKGGLLKSKDGVKPNAQKKPIVPTVKVHFIYTKEDIAPPLPERNSYPSEDKDNDEEEQIYAKPIKEATGNSYSHSKDVHYSLVKETQINKENNMNTNPQNVLYSEVKLDQSLPSALGHLQASLQGPNRKPRVISSSNELSECEVLEMRFATSIQTVNTKTFLHAGAECSGNSLMFPTALSHSEVEDTYAQIPFREPHCANEYHTVDKISNYSMCTKNTYDHISTRTSKEVTSREINRKVAHATSAQDNTYEAISRDFTNLGLKKKNVAKVEKQKKFFFGDKKK